MSTKHPLLNAAASALLVALLSSAALAGSVLVSNPSWQFTGPQPIQGVQANFGGVLVGGGFPATGRVTSIVVDSTGGGTCGASGNSVCRILVGTAGGGLWMTTDGGNTFTKITGILDPNATSNGSFPQTTVGSVALNPTTSPPTIYLATGEGNHSDSFWGDGIFTSANLGASWSQIAGSVTFEGGSGSLPASKGFEGFTRIAVDPSHSPPYVFVAATDTTGINRAGLLGEVQTYSGFWGIWRSTDGGATFTQQSVSQMGGCISTGTLNTPCTGDDVVIDPSTDYVYAAVHDSAYGTSGNFAVVHSTDSGNTWTSLALPGITQGEVGRISLAASGGTVYVMVGSSDNRTYLGFLKSANSGSSWTQGSVPCQGFNNNTVVVDGLASANSACGGVGSTFSQSFYDQALAIQPGSGGNTVAFAGVGVYLSTNSGVNWSFLGAAGGIHSDVHALQFDPFNSNILYAGTDGGVFKIDVTNPSSPAINALTGSGANTIVAAQLYSIGPHPIGTSSPAVDAQTFLAGLQDNGTTLSAPSPTAQPTPSVQWNEVDTGDGGFASIDANDPTYAYHDFASNRGVPSPNYSTNGGAAGSWIFSPPKLDPRDLGPQFFAPLAGDPSVAQFVLLGSFFTYASANGMQSWTQQTTQDLTRGCAAGSSPCAVTDLSFAPSDHTKAYAVTGIPSRYTGSAPGGFYVWNTGKADLTSGTTWSEITGNLRNNNHQQSYVIEPSSLTVDPNNAKSVYLGLQCIPPGNANCVSSLYRATPNGSSTTWAGVDGSKGSNPINGPVYKVLVDNTDSTSKHLLAGTAGGLFTSSDGGADWTPYNGGGQIPNVPVLDIEQNSAGQIFVATHGAGAYKLSVPTFVGHTDKEVAENGCGSSCNISVSPPAGAQPGDVFLVLFQGVVNNLICVESVVSNQSGWTELPFATNGVCGNQLTISGDPYVFLGTWVYAHVYTANDPATYSFTFNNLGGNGFASEGVAYLVSYRGASQDFSTYTLYGWPAGGDSKTVSIPQDTNIPSNATLVNIFQAENSDTNEDNNIGVTFSVPTGSPALTLQTSRSVVFPYLVGDVFTGPTGGTFGGYSTSDGVNSLNTAIQIVVPAL